MHFIREQLLASSTASRQQADLSPSCIPSWFFCTCSRNAVAFGVDRSRSLKYAGSFAQLCSSARLAVPALLALLRALLRDLENLSAVTHGAQIFQVRRAASDARERSVYRKTVLTRIEEKRQHLATYGWTRP